MVRGGGDVAYHTRLEVLTINSQDKRLGAIVCVFGVCGVFKLLRLAHPQPQALHAPGIPTEVTISRVESWKRGIDGWVHGLVTTEGASITLFDTMYFAGIYVATDWRCT